MTLLSEGRTGRVALIGIAMLAIVLTVGLARAGTVSVAWDPVSDADLAGYRVYYGTSPGALDRSKDVGLTTSTVLTGLADCTTWYVSARAYDSGGLESASDSNLVEGWPRPVVSTLDASTIRQGQTRTFTVTGTNFDPGDAADPAHPAASVVLSHPGLTVESTQVDACGSLRVRIRAASNASLGMSDLTVENPDVSWSNPGSHPAVFGTRVDAIEVLPASNDTTPPTVNGASPGAGETNVPPTDQPLVNFSEELDPASVTTQTVQLRDAQDRAVSLQAGYPQASGSQVRLLPALPLADGQTYHLFVRGGSSGVKDLAGNPLAGDWNQQPGFRVLDAARGRDHGPAVVYASPEAGAVGVSRLLTEVRVTFDRDISALGGALSRSELQQRLAVLDEGRALAQASDSPRFEQGGRTVCVLLAEPVLEDRAYTTLVHLSGADLARRLEQQQLGELVMDQPWMSRPSWRVEGALERITYRDGPSGADKLLEPSSGSAPLANSAVPTTSEFRVTFSSPVSPASANDSVFRVLATTGRRYQPVPLQTVQRTDGGKTVVLRPKQPLPAGAWGMVQVRTGPAGVYLLNASGQPFPLPPGSNVGAPFATEVGPQSLAGTFGVAE